MKSLNFTSWNSFFTFASSSSNHDKGLQFELLTVSVLKSHPIYASTLEHVWLLRDGLPSNIKKKLNMPQADEGIDIIAQTYSGQFWAIQCKFKASKEPPTMRELSTFNNLAHTHCKNISLAILFHTGERGVRKKHLMGDKYAEVGLEFWLGLSSQDWIRINESSKTKKAKPVLRKPRDHQKKAIKSAQEHYLQQNASRGRLIMPCGTGKSLTAFWIANALKANSIIVAVPSLNLIKQSLEDWTAEFVAQNETHRPEWQVICSDDSTSKLEDEFVNDVYSLGIPTSTSIDEIELFLKRKTKGRKIIFTTYQSSDRLAQAARKAKFSFDLAILDEAHKTVGIKSKSFATLLSDTNIFVKKRMFMTATERVLRGTNDDVLSMDNETIYGKRFYQLTFKDAIHSSPQIISDYKILTIAVTNTQIQEIIQKNKLLSDKKIKLEEQDAQSLAAAIALRQATKKYGIKHAISFHRSIKAAESFTNLNLRLNSSKVDRINLTSYHISSKKSAGQRSQLLDDFKAEKLALMTNARCLTEGVNVPTIDCVLFADPKQSIVDIVQAAGRALRVSPGKKYGYIMMPLIVPDNMELEEFTETTPFKQVSRIVAALSTQDERIVEEFRLNDQGKRTSDRRVEISGSIPVGLKLEISHFIGSIESKMWERIGRCNWRSYEDSVIFTSNLGLKNIKDWAKFSSSGKKPPDIPFKPYNAYKEQWKGWNHWLGTDNVNNWQTSKQFFTLAQAKEYIEKNCKGLISSQSQYNKWVKSEIKGLPKKPKQMPSAPWQTYKKDPDWKGLGDFLSTGRIASREVEYIHYDSAKNILKKFALKNREEYFRWYKDNNEKMLKKGFFLPKYCNQTYKSEWEGWNIFLNNKNPHGKKNVDWMPFEKARAFVRKLGLKSTQEWKLYCQGKLKGLPELPYNIPTIPGRQYENEGFRSIMDWLGTKEIRKDKNVVSFNKAKEFARKLKIEKVSDWNKYTKNEFKHLPKLPEGYPQHPILWYKNHKDWKGMGDFLGITTNFNVKYLPFKKAHAFILKLKLKSQTEWRTYCKSDKMPSNIPTNPHRTYEKSGWVGLGHWLGTGNIRTKDIDFIDFRNARRIIIDLKLKTRDEYLDWWRTVGKFNDPIFPAKPDRTYENKGWISWSEFLGTGILSNKEKEFRTFNRAKTFVHKLKLKSQAEWRLFVKSDKRPKDIPYNVDRYYASEWISWPDFLGKK
jgi:superfamily II DNA or RNA helicase